MERGASRDRGPKLFPLLSIVLSTSFFAAPSHAGKSFDFAFHDEEYLLPRQHSGGRAYVPKQVTADAPVPLVVFLHGVNRRNRLHMWLGAGPADLRARLDKWIAQGDLPPAVLAAPSQTRDALWPAMLWTGIELDEFVAAAEKAVAGRARISRDHVIVAGHSGAGCNADGGLLKIAVDRGAIDRLALSRSIRAYSDQPGQRFQSDLGKDSGALGHGVGAKRRSDGQVVVGWSLESSPFFFRIDGPLSHSTWALWTRRSQMASAVGSASASCQLFGGTCEVITVELWS